MKKSIKSILVLVCICATVAVLLAIVNSVTAPIITENEQRSVNDALLEVMPEGGSFSLMDISNYTLPSTVSEVYRAENGGYVVKLTTNGYSSGMVLLCGVSSSGTVTGAKLISSAETPAIGGVAAESFSLSAVGRDVSNIDGVDTISGATKTTVAYRAAIKDALNTAIILGENSADTTAEDELPNENLSASAPGTEGTSAKNKFFEEVHQA